MTLLNDRPAEVTAGAGRPERTLGKKIVSVITTTDHKTIGRLYMGTSFTFFLIAGLMARLSRAELARPGLQIVTLEQYNQLFTMHGSIMLLLFATALFVGFANFLMPDMPGVFARWIVRNYEVEMLLWKQVENNLLYFCFIQRNLARTVVKRSHDPF